MPEVIRIFGLASAEIRKEIRELELSVIRVTNEKLIGLMDNPYAHQFKNEQMRTAYVETDLNLQKIKKDIIDKQYELDQITEEIRKYRNLMQSLDNISKLKISERRY
jgi:meiotically up-regulated gene 157 (Mug157) protein